jgi:hypothetical protein
MSKNTVQVGYNATIIKDLDLFWLVPSESSTFAFCLMVQNSCYSSSHHAYISFNRKKEKGKERTNPLFTSTYHTSPYIPFARS